MLGVIAGSGALGTLPGWLTFVAIIAAAWIFFRGGTGTAVSGLQDTNRELERQIKERDGKISALERINAELRAEKDVTVAIIPVLNAMRAHEERAQERHAATLPVLQLMADGLAQLGLKEANGTQLTKGDTT